MPLVRIADGTPGELRPGTSAEVAICPRITTLPPGKESAMRHFHTREDELEFVLEGADLWAVRRVDARCFGRDHLFTGLYQWFDFVDNGLPRLHDRLHPAPRLQTVRRGRPAGDRIVNLQPRLQHNSD